MTSNSFFKDPFSKVMSILPNPLSSRQTGSATIQGDGSQSSVRQPHTSKTVSSSSTNLLATGSAEPQNNHGAGHTSSPGDPSPSTQPRTVNVVLFGETGVGKSSVINLIARKDVAKVSSDVNGCTMQSTRYDIPFDGMKFSIFDTIGLEEPQMGINGYLKAIEKAHELIVSLGAAGGIHLLLFCMRGGRITATTQSNYRLFCECLCDTKVPIALVFTGLEREVEMEDWWTRNKTHVEQYGIRSDGHACITAVQDDIPGEKDLKYMKSQERIRELLKTCALKNEAFSLEPHTWLGKLGKGMLSFIEKYRNPKRRDVMWVLTTRCKLDRDTARKIADMMKRGDPEPKGEQPGNREGEGQPNAMVVKGENQGEPAGNGEGKGRPDPVVAKDEQAGTRESEGRPSPVVVKDENQGERTENRDGEGRPSTVIEKDENRGEQAGNREDKGRPDALAGNGENRGGRTGNREDEDTPNPVLVRRDEHRGGQAKNEKGEGTHSSVARKDKIQGEQVGNREGEGGPNSVVVEEIQGVRAGDREEDTPTSVVGNHDKQAGNRESKGTLNYNPVVGSGKPDSLSKHETKPRDDGMDGGRDRNVGDQSPDVSVLEQAKSKQDDTRQRPGVAAAASPPVPSKQVATHGSRRQS